jgi:hypothetical protein
MTYIPLTRPSMRDAPKPTKPRMRNHGFDAPVYTEDTDYPLEGKVLSISEASASSASSASSVATPGQATIEMAITLALPTELVKTDKDFRLAVFRLARHLKGVAPSLLDSQLRPLVQRWHGLASRFLQGRTFVDTWSEFLPGWPKVRHPVGDGQVERSWLAANSLPPLPQASQYDDPRIGVLMTLCSQLQKANGNQSFSLGYRTVGQLFGISHTHGGNWLTMLVKDRFLEIVEAGGGFKGGQRTARTYRLIEG